MNCKNIENAFIAYLNGYLDSNVKIEDFIPTMPKVRVLNKKEIMANEGEACREAFWLYSGYGRYFKRVTDKDGVKQDETIDFCKPGGLLFVSKGFFDDSISDFGFELSAGAVIIPFSKDSYESSILKCPELALITNKILVSDKFESFQRMDLVKMKPRERYSEFLSFFGVDIEQCFALKHIANNLGIDPTFLSRIRGEFGNRKFGLIKYLQILYIILYFI